LTISQREVLDSVYRAAVKRVDPYAMVRNLIRLEGTTDKTLVATDEQGVELRFPLSGFDRIVVTGAGKASAPMARAIEGLLSDKIDSSLVVVKYGHTDTGRGPFKHIHLRESGHPVPDQAGIEAAKELMKLASSCDRRTLVINLISGGGSALLPAPFTWEHGTITLQDKQETTRLLLASGVDIHKINGVRKHLSALKGGRLAALFAPATSVNLLLSDVVGDPLDVIASGPTVPDPTTWKDAWATLEASGILKKVPKSVFSLIQAGVKGLIPDTPKPGDPAFETTHNLLVGTNYSALKAAELHAQSLGLHTLVLTSMLSGEARELALVFSAIARDQKRRKIHGEGPLLVLAGGESTVTLRGNGKGGRNQEMALAFLAELARLHEPLDGIVFLSAATDGDDGPTDAAGAFASFDLLRFARQIHLDPADYLMRNDAYHFFEKIDALYKTGPTNTNVCDIQFLMVE